MARTTSPDPHRHAYPRTLSRVLRSLARQIACHGVNRLSGPSVKLALRRGSTLLALFTAGHVHSLITGLHGITARKHRRQPQNGRSNAVQQSVSNSPAYEQRDLFVLESRASPRYKTQNIDSLSPGERTNMLTVNCSAYKSDSRQTIARVIETSREAARCFLSVTLYSYELAHYRRFRNALYKFKTYLLTYLLTS